MRAYSRLIVVAFLCMASPVMFSCGGGGDSGTTYYQDIDGDGFGDAAVSRVLDSDQAGWVLDSTDCLDSDELVHPGAAEICGDEMDNDCDTLPDCYDGDDCTGHQVCVSCADADNDGYLLFSDHGCSGGNDCDDTDSTVHPGVDGDGDGLDICEDCDDGDPLTGGGTEEVCNGVDDDCDWFIDEGFDVDMDGYTSCGGDCDDNNVDVSPAAEELCNGVDDDCDGQVDEPGSVGCSSYFRDADGDGYGTAEMQCVCEPSGQFTALNSSDCYDANANAHPNQTQWFTVNRGDGSFDYDCSGNETRRWTAQGECAGAVWVCTTSDSGWRYSVPACGITSQWITGCTGTISSCDPDTVARTQQCR